MTPEKFKKGIMELHQAQLTKSEKEIMLKNIIETPIEIPHTKENFISSNFSVWRVFMGHSRFSYALAVSLIFLLSGGSAIYASEKALPGEILYKLKINVTEPFRDKFARTPEALASWEAVKATRRLEEAEALARSKKLGESVRVKLEQDFKKHADKVDIILGEIKASGKDDSADKIKKEFDSAVFTHKKVLEGIRDNTGTSEEERNGIESINTVINRTTERDKDSDERGIRSNGKEINKFNNSRKTN